MTYLIPYIYYQIVVLCYRTINNIKAPRNIVFHKKMTPTLLPITSANFDRFSIFFTIGLSSDCVMIIKDPIKP